MEEGEREGQTTTALLLAFLIQAGSFSVSHFIA